MKKLMFPVFCSLFLGVMMGYYLFHEYDSTVKIKPVFQETSEKVYFFQLGVYSDLESVQNSTRSFTNYIYVLEDSQYHVYVALTKSSKNVEKIKGYFEKKGYDIYVKEMVLSDEEYLEKLEQYDQVLEQTSEEEAIENVIAKIVTAYKEMVIDRGKNETDSQTGTS